MTRSIDRELPRVVAGLQGGRGEVKFYDIASKDELFGHARLFSHVVLEPGCSIGRHPHRDEGEIYYILSGEGVYDDNGTERTVKAGDVTVCGSGECHGLENRGAAPLEFIAIIPQK